MHRTIAALLVLASTACALAQEKPVTTPNPAGAHPLPPNPRIFDITRVRNGVDVPYLVTFPPEYQPGPAYPVLIYFGDGEQDRAAVVAQLARWEKEAAARRWVLVGVAKPVQGVASLLAIPQDSWQGVLEEVGRILPAEGGTYYLAGVGEGGKAALYLGGLAPDKVKAVLSVNAAADESLLGITSGLRDQPVAVVVGEMDKAGLQSTNKTIAALQEAGAARAYEVIVPGAAREQVQVTPAQVFELLALMGGGKPPILKENAAEQGEGAELARAGAVLNALHDAAAKAEEARYFSLYAEGAVFLGTDAKERWTLEEFKAFAHPYFARGKAWTYTPVEGGRFITIEGKERDVAWFDEKLENDKLGLCRGSGVLVKHDGQWKVKQYNLTMLVPNEIAEEVAKKSSEVK